MHVKSIFNLLSLMYLDIL